MKMLTIKQEHDCFHIYDEQVCMYTIGKEDSQYVLKNAYDRKVAMLRPAKESFSLFQDKKKHVYDVLFETRNIGSFTEQKQVISLQDTSGTYRFYSGRMMGKDMLIGYEEQAFIFQIDHYEDHATMFLKQPEYAVYAALYYAYFIDQGKQHSDAEDFLSHLPEDMMSFV